MNILIIGAPASGKGTVCKGIAKEFSLKHISTGDIFRSEIASGSEKGKLIASFTENGKLAPSDILIEVMKEYLSKPENKDNMLLDGFGKTLDEIKVLDNFFKIDKVIYLDATYENLVSRIAKRRICADCGFITTTDETPTSICPKCSAELIKRKDDTEQVYKVRYDVFQKHTFPIVDYFKKSGRLCKVNAEQAPNKVLGEIRQELHKLSKKNCQTTSQKQNYML